MAADFYTEWLGVPPGPRPPDYYTLLGVKVFCRDQDIIERAARRQLTRLDEFALYPDRDTRDEVQDMMNEVARARVDLVNPKRCLAYDRKLAQKLGVDAPPAVEAETRIAPLSIPQAPAPIEKTDRKRREEEARRRHDEPRPAIREDKSTVATYQAKRKPHVLIATLVLLIVSIGVGIIINLRSGHDSTSKLAQAQALLKQGISQFERRDYQQSQAALLKATSLKAVTGEEKKTLNDYLTRVDAAITKQRAAIEAYRLLSGRQVAQ